MNQVGQTLVSHRSGQRPTDRGPRWGAVRRHTAFELVEPRKLLHANHFHIDMNAGYNSSENPIEDLLDIKSVDCATDLRFGLSHDKTDEYFTHIGTVRNMEDCSDRDGPGNTSDRILSSDRNVQARASISGFVYLKTNVHDEQPAGNKALENVTIQLLDEESNFIAVTRTDRNGYYLFEALIPGLYSIIAPQPPAFFDGGQKISNGDRDSSNSNLVKTIQLQEEPLTGINFFNLSAASLSGFVFQDGEPVITYEGRPADNLLSTKDGQLTPDDIRLPGVIVELRNGMTGQPITGAMVIPGTYPAGPIQTTTNADGYYQFDGLPPGNYAIYTIQPQGFADGIDTPGTTSGIAVNPGNSLHYALLDSLAEEPHNDAILRIPLRHGEHSQMNNFSEIIIGQETIVFPLHLSENHVTHVPPVMTPVQPTVNRPAVTPIPETFLSPELNGSGGTIRYAWHLSIVNAGHPRGDEKVKHGDSTVWLTSATIEPPTWDSQFARKARWRLANVRNGKITEIRYDIFGLFGSIPITGDFNGDGTDDYGVFFQGEWFLDLNGDRTWDRYDLWAKLGSDGDLPVTGDWDGDGKDDIGIFGTAWPGDRRALAAEPGLPDVNSRETGRYKNLPPQSIEATIGHRLLKFTSQGRSRADLIDHVFHAGKAGDRPVTGDWNGDGIRTVGVFQNGTWFLDWDGDGRLTSHDKRIRFGQSNDTPVVGDFNGDGIDEIGIYRSGIWILDTNGNGKQDSRDEVFRLGNAVEFPVIGDWDGDGTDDVGVYGEVIANVASLPRPPSD